MIQAPHDLSRSAGAFPALVAARDRGRVLADNAAGAQLPACALERMETYLRVDNAQKGSIFARTLATSALVAQAKSAFAELIGVAPQTVGTGLNATTIAFAFARCIAPHVRAGDRVVVTAADHEANVAPWRWLGAFGAHVEVVPVNAWGDLDLATFERALEREPLLVALPWASNATGTVFDLATLSAAAKRAGAVVVADGVQAAPHLALEVPADVDIAFFSAYKIFGPHIGFWYATDETRERLFVTGDAEVPGGDAAYWSVETGTQSHEGLAGWLGTCAYLREIGAGDMRAAMRTIAAHETKLCARARQRFAELAPHVVLHGRPAEMERLPVFAFNVPGVGGASLAHALDAAGIEARYGDYYSPRLMRAIAADFGGTAVRLSFAHYTYARDIERCCDAIAALVP